VIKSMRIGWNGFVAEIGVLRSAYNMYFGNLG
jgi:hypothetical protein